MRFFLCARLVHASLSRQLLCGTGQRMRFLDIGIFQGLHLRLRMCEVSVRAFKTSVNMDLR